MADPTDVAAIISEAFAPETSDALEPLHGPARSGTPETNHSSEGEKQDASEGQQAGTVESPESQGPPPELATKDKRTEVWKRVQKREAKVEAEAKQLAALKAEVEGKLAEIKAAESRAAARRKLLDESPDIETKFRILNEDYGLDENSSVELFRRWSKAVGGDPSEAAVARLEKKLEQMEAARAEEQRKREEADKAASQKQVSEQAERQLAGMFAEVAKSSDYPELVELSQVHPRGLEGAADELMEMTRIMANGGTYSSVREAYRTGVLELITFLRSDKGKAQLAAMRAQKTSPATGGRVKTPGQGLPAAAASAPSHAARSDQLSEADQYRQYIEAIPAEKYLEMIGLPMEGRN